MKKITIILASFALVLFVAACDGRPVKDCKNDQGNPVTCNSVPN